MSWLKKIYMKMESWFTPKGIAIFRFIFGHYYEFSSSPLKRFLLKLYCIFCSVWMFLHYLVFADRKYIVYIYDSTTAVEISVNILISLIFKHDFSFFNSSSSKVYAPVTYFIIFCAVINSIIYFIASLEYIVLLDNILFYFEYISSICARISLMFDTEMYEKSIRSLCKNLKSNLETINITADEKRRHVKQFIEDYMRFTNFSESRARIQKLKVSLHSVCTYLYLEFLFVSLFH
ncbi:hypothetical protein B5X24_HaOG207794 [Helicoverpa armigera]|nr:hypothetical protein B5X24_HaOG207794 [Helicoverpa armigera]